MALPLALAMLALGWFLLTRVVYRLPHRPVAGARAAIKTPPGRARPDDDRRAARRRGGAD